MLLCPDTRVGEVGGRRSWRASLRGIRLNRILILRRTLLRFLVLVAVVADFPLQSLEVVAGDQRPRTAF